SPLPPYIRTRLDDADRYQTTYARGDPVSAAAPTAGLHFTAETLGALRDAGIGFCTLQLEIGLATFAPIRTRHVDEHRMHEERFAIPVATAEMIEQTRVSGGRIVAVGTTVMRALEAAAGATGTVTTGAGTTRLFITPGHQFRVADALLTNFHQPRSSLLVLLAAFIGMQRWRDAYAHALDTGYRFLSLGDCMLCWRAA
ncbi:MAG: S-adenosylmethionine:tRNA ribosyltransferase-isomerase, partial [Candidatus Dormibacteraeota bacterium]|nr:S-adenosylmethionine:tRNA ribosyltransferase-isomerase [Candidatus Dormibacteraeota bacterium]